MSYDEIKQMIIDTLMGRPVGTEIQPENHQEYALALLDYARSLEVTSTSPLIGIADENTMPLQPSDANVSYLTGVAEGTSRKFNNFYDSTGNPITISNTGDYESSIVILLWDKTSWSYEKIDTTVKVIADKAFKTYNLTLRKTYASVAALQADKVNPIGNDGKPIRVGETVSVVNSSNTDENAIYSYEANNTWVLQMKTSEINRVFDGGCAGSTYGGTNNINCGGA